MPEPFKLTAQWPGSTVAVLASGPSMTREVAATVRASGVKTIAVNNQAIATNGHEAMAPWANVLYAADAMWWCQNKEAIKDYKGLKMTIMPNNGVYPNTVSPDVLVLANGGPRGLDPRVTHLRTGHNSGYQAVHLAMNFGAKRIVLCGFDMHSKNGEHWFGHHKWRQKYASRYDLFITAFNVAAPEYKARGVEVINATPGSALKCFPFAELEEALDGMRSVRASASKAPAAGEEEAGGDREAHGGVPCGAAAEG
jgi:hypothetical protein